MGNRVIYIPTNDVEKPQQRCVLYFGNQRSVIYERIYEEYEWLVGDRTAYIQSNSLTYNLWASKLEIKIGKVNISDSDTTTLMYFQLNRGKGNVRMFNISRDIANGSISRFYTRFRNNETSGGYFNVYSPYSSMPSELTALYYIDNRVAKVEIDDVISSGNTLNESAWNTDVPLGKSYIIKMSYVREVLPNGSYRSNLVPCKLLQSIPAILDGNGIARQAGECGMWDKVSNRFYGNVASSGAFTVKNPKCYEEYNWLIDNRIDGNYAYMYGIEYDLWNNHLQMMIGQSSRGSNRFFTYTDGNNCVLKMYRDNTTDKLNVVFRESSGTQHIADVSLYSEMPDGVEFDFYIENALSYCKKNGIIYTNNGNPTCTQSNWTSIQPTIYSAKMGYIREVLPDGTYKSNLVPCKLTHGIPASMDANGIARPSGTCGMWDKVNDVFYGNVANSGSFSVSN